MPRISSNCTNQISQPCENIPVNLPVMLFIMIESGHNSARSRQYHFLVICKIMAWSGHHSEIRSTLVFWRVRYWKRYHVLAISFNVAPTTASPQSLLWWVGSSDKLYASCLGQLLPVPLGVSIIINPSLDHTYRQLANLKRIKSQKLNVSRPVLQLSLSNPVKPGVKSRMKMWLDSYHIESK